MDTNGDTPRMQENASTNAEAGVVKWAPVKSVWYLANLLIGVVGGVLFFSFSGLLIFIVFTVITLCLGHSLGMHRRLIHNSYDCPRWMEYFFVHLGVLVGMAGPFGMVHQHDLRDWAQRKKNCHAYLRHGSRFLGDGWWQLNCDLVLDNPPDFIPETRIKNDAIYHWMEKWWMWQQLPWAIVLFYFGGVSWIVWGICMRVAVSISGHWLIGYFAHNHGQRDWHVSGAAVQGHNIKLAGLITMGESWHNNHHAFPGSAMLGIYRGQADPGWWVLNILRQWGLVWDIRLPDSLPVRDELRSLNGKGLLPQFVNQKRDCRMCGRVYTLISGKG